MHSLTSGFRKRERLIFMILIFAALLGLIAGCGANPDVHDESGRPVPVPIATEMNAAEKAIEAQTAEANTRAAEPTSTPIPVPSPDAFATWAWSVGD